MMIATYLLDVSKKESVVVCRISDDRILTYQSNFEKQQLLLFSFPRIW